jgi:hypothetical protein
MLDADETSEAAAIEHSVAREARMRLLQLTPFLEAAARDLLVLASSEAPSTWRSNNAAAAPLPAWGQLSIPDAGAELKAAIAAAHAAAAAPAPERVDSVVAPSSFGLPDPGPSEPKRSRWDKAPDAASGVQVASQSQSHYTQPHSSVPVPSWQAIPVASGMARALEAAGVDDMEL